MQAVAGWDELKFQAEMDESIVNRSVAADQKAAELD